MKRIGLHFGNRGLVVLGLLALFAIAPISNGEAVTMGNCSLQTSVNCTG